MAIWVHAHVMTSYTHLYESETRKYGLTLCRTWKRRKASCESSTAPHSSSSDITAPPPHLHCLCPSHYCSETPSRTCLHLFLLLQWSKNVEVLYSFGSAVNRPFPSRLPGITVRVSACPRSLHKHVFHKNRAKRSGLAEISQTCGKRGFFIIIRSLFTEGFCCVFCVG